ncbi:MAG: hypothetical protein V1808_02205 [Candidatus Daviesbacteria bacterium]
MLKIAKIVGLNSDTDAALALALQGQIDPLAKNSVSLFALVTASLDDAFSRTRQALAEGESVFFSSSQPVSARLSEVFDSVKSLLSDANNLQILLAAISDDETGTVLYLFGQGQSLKGYLARGEKKVNLFDMSEGQLVSGLVNEGDRVILTTQSLLDILDDKFEDLSKMPIENIEDEIANLLPEAQTYPVAAVFLEKEMPPTETEGGEINEVQQSESAKADYLKVFLPILKTVGGVLKQIIIRFLPRTKKRMALVGLVLLIIVLVFLGISYKKGKDREIWANFNQNFKAASESFNKAQSLKDSDLVQSVKSLEESKKSLAEALKIQPQNQEALNLKKQIEEGTSTILRVSQVNDFPLWLDLELVKKGFRAKKLSLSHGKILVLDDVTGSLVKIDLASKAPQILAGEEKLGEAKLASLNGNVSWIFSQDKGIIKHDGTGSQITVAAKPDSEWGNITDIYGFAGNIYLLDDDKNQIWKYMPIEAGYSDKRNYFREDTKASLGGTIKMQIDSSIWVLKGNGEILKFTQGASDYFALSGLDKGVKDPKSFFVSDQTDNIYILDSGNNKLVVVDKKGVYKSSYASDKFSTFSDLVVDEKGKKVYLLEGSKISLLELK